MLALLDLLQTEMTDFPPFYTSTIKIPSFSYT